MSSASLETVYISAGCNRSPNCLAWRKDVLLYASCDAVVVARRCDDAGSAPLVVTATLCGHSGRVNCVRWLDDDAGHFATASADGTAAVWKKSKAGNVNFERARVLRGHSQEVTLSAGVKTGPDASFLIATTAGDCTIKTWLVDPSLEEVDGHEQSNIDLGRGLCMELQVTLVDKGLAMILASMEDCRIHIFGGQVDGEFAPLPRS